MFDITLVNGRVIDGSGNPWVKADIGIKDGKIISLGDLSDEKAERIIDVNGFVVTPGFIDPHSHSDGSIIKNKEALSSLQQGITTEFVGNCGGSRYFPVTDKNRKNVLMSKADLFETDLDKVSVDWTDFAGFRARLEEMGIGINLACFVGHNTVRWAVMGEEGEGGERSVPTEKELKEMKRFVAEAMEQGCWGITTGLVYKPGRNAKTEEIIELCKVVTEYRGSYMSHIRGYRSLEGLKEFLEIAEKTPIRSILSHMGVRRRTKKKRLVGPLPEEVLLLFDKARKRGAEIYMDIYPWGGASSSSMVSILLDTKDKFDKNGKRLTFKNFMDMLKDPEKRKQIEDRAHKRQEKSRKLKEDTEKVKHELGDASIVNRSIRFPEYVERSMAEIAEMRGTDIITAAADILLEDDGNTFWGSWKCEGDLKRLFKHPAVMVSTDGHAVAMDDPMVHLGAAPAVRLFGSFPKVLGVYVREDRLFSLEEAVRRMTSLPAKAIGIEDRGLIRPGMWADLVVFDPDRIAHMATYFEPRQYCVGIDYVLVNGELAMDQGEMTNVLAGKAIIH